MGDKSDIPFIEPLTVSVSPDKEEILEYSETENGEKSGQDKWAFFRIWNHISHGFHWLKINYEQNKNFH